MKGILVLCVAVIFVTSGTADSDYIKELTEKFLLKHPDLNNPSKHYDFHEKPKRKIIEKLHLTYAIRGEPIRAINPSHPSKTMLMNLVKEALEFWTIPLRRDITPAEDFDEADVRISFVDRDHGDFYPFELDSLTGRQVAHAFMPSNEAMSGEIHLSKDEIWDLSDEAGPSEMGLNFGVVLRHELGHFFGLPDSRDPESIMYTDYRANDDSLALPDSETMHQLLMLYERERTRANVIRPRAQPQQQQPYNFPITKGKRHMAWISDKELVTITREAVYLFRYEGNVMRLIDLSFHTKFRAVTRQRPIRGMMGCRDNAKYVVFYDKFVIVYDAKTFNSLYEFDYPSLGLPVFRHVERVIVGTANSPLGIVGNGRKLYAVEAPENVFCNYQ